jgi:hypothetical protein
METRERGEKEWVSEASRIKRERGRENPTCIALTESKTRKGGGRGDS